MDKKLLKKFKEGKCTPEELEKVLQWYQSKEAEDTFSDEIDKIWNDPHEIEFPDKKKILLQIKTQIKEKKGGSIDEVKVCERSYYNFSQQYRPLLVTSFALILITFVAIYYLHPQLFQLNPSHNTINIISKSIKKGQKHTMWLADGTKVKMNSASTIRYPESFTDSIRLIEFEGEAFFEVAEDTSRPFVIEAGNIRTTVLGTSFNLRTTSTSEEFEVAVITGSVKVSHSMLKNSKEEQMLSPNQSAVFDKESNTFKVGTFDPDSVLAWTNGTIIFKDASLTEIFHTLEKWYGVKIDTSNLNRNIPKGYTGSYTNKSLETVLEGISYVLDFKYELKDKKVIIK